MVRAIRLARLARALRLMIQFKTLWLLCQGLLHSIVSLFWTFVLLGTCMYMFAVAGMEMIPPRDLARDTVYNAMATDSFGSIFDSMLSLSMVLAFDGGAPIYGTLVTHGNRLLLIPYFCAFIFISSIALLNLVTAIMVQSCGHQAKEDREVQASWEMTRKRALLPKLKQLFQVFDADGSGNIDLEEINNAPWEVKTQLAQLVQIDSVEELFRLLDYDNDGCLGMEEFLEGIMKAQGDKPLEFTCIIKQCADIRKDTRALIASLQSLGATVENSLLDQQAPTGSPKKTGDVTPRYTSHSMWLSPDTPQQSHGWQHIMQNVKDFTRRSANELTH